MYCVAHKESRHLKNKRIIQSLAFTTTQCIPIWTARRCQNTPPSGTDTRPHSMHPTRSTPTGTSGKTEVVLLHVNIISIPPKRGGRPCSWYAQGRRCFHREHQVFRIIRSLRKMQIGSADLAMRQDHV